MLLDSIRTQLDTLSKSERKVALAVLAAVATAGGDLTTPAGAATGFSWGFLAAAGIAAGLAVAAFLAMPATRATGQARMHMH